MYIIKYLKSIKAEAYVTTCVFAVIFVSIFSIIFTFSAAVSKVDMMRENTKVVLDSFVTENAVEIFKSIKQGNDYTEAINEEDFRTALVKFCALEMREDKLYSMDEDGTEKYQITNSVITFREENKLELIASYTISVPLIFAGMSFTTVSVPIEVTSILTEKF